MPKREAEKMLITICRCQKKQDRFLSK